MSTLSQAAREDEILDEMELVPYARHSASRALWSSLELSLASRFGTFTQLITPLIQADGQLSWKSPGPGTHEKYVEHIDPFMHWLVSIQAYSSTTMCVPKLQNG